MARNTLTDDSKDVSTAIDGFRFFKQFKGDGLSATADLQRVLHLI